MRKEIQVTRKLPCYRSGPRKANKRQTTGINISILAIVTRSGLPAEISSLSFSVVCFRLYRRGLVHGLVLYSETFSFKTFLMQQNYIQFIV